MGKKKQNSPVKLNERPHYYGIDLLRCLSMLMIVMLHLYTQGGALNATLKAAPKSFAYVLNYALKLICLGGVNLYGMISGYVMLEGTFKLRRFLSLWLQVVFVGLVLNVLAIFIRPGFLTRENWILAILPVSQREYWYFTCYTCVLLLSPALNRGIRAMTEQQAVLLLLGCIFVLSILSGIGYSYSGDAFYVVGGYSALWLIALYVMGACIKRSGLLSGAKSATLLLVMLASVAVALIYHFLPLPEFFDESKKMATRFIDLPLVIFDLCLFALTVRLDIRSEKLRKLLLWLSPLTFSVYLITLHPLFWELQKSRFTFAAKGSVWLTAPILLGCGIAIFTVCILADKLRDLLFRLVRVDRLCLWAEQRIRSVFDKFSRHLLGRK